MRQGASRCFRAAFFAAAALLLAAGEARAWPGPTPYPLFFYPYPPPAYPAPPAYRGCDGSEPILGGIFGAAMGGLIGTALGQDHRGRVDPGATMFGAIAGAVLGATLAASGCDDYR